MTPLTKNISETTVGVIVIIAALLVGFLIGVPIGIFIFNNLF